VTDMAMNSGVRERDDTDGTFANDTLGSTRAFANANLNWGLDGYRAGHTEGFLPSVYIVEPSSSCNLSCVMCPNSLLEDHGVMPMSLFTRVIDEIGPSAKAILLYRMGEPLLNRHLPEMIAYAKQRTSANLILSTNATLLEGRTAELIVDSGLDEIILCIDGATAETHEAIRKGSSFARVRKNVESFIALASERGGPRCIVQMVGLRQNRHEAVEFDEYWSRFDCDVTIQWVDTWAGQFSELATGSAVPSPNVARKRLPCADLWLKAVVDWRGRVLLCCHDWSSANVVGDLRVDSIESIWASQTMIELRRKHVALEFEELPLCRSCKEWSAPEDEFAYFAEYQDIRRRRP
jgi:MoaA/NifB/PqqE/SkfB family radical SAM enzyme